MSNSSYYNMIMDGANTRYLCRHDELHETRGSYAYETEEETKAAEDEELEKLASGELVVLYIQKQRRVRDCPCPECSGWHQVDVGVGGVVIDNDEDKVLEYCKEMW